MTNAKIRSKTGAMARAKTSTVISAVSRWRADGRALPGWRTVRGRMAVVLIIPTCLLLALVGLAVDARAQEYGDAQSTLSRVDLTLRVQALVHQLQRERGLTNGLLGGENGYRAPLDQQRVQVDAAGVGLHDEPIVASAMGRLDRLSTVRDQVDHGTADRTATLRFYTDAIDALNTASSSAGAASLGDQRLRDALAALDALADATESVALERGSLNGVFAAGAFQGREYLAFTETRATRIAALDRYQQVATVAERTALDRAFGTPAAQKATAYERRAENGAAGQPLHTDAQDWWAAMTTLVDDLYRVQQTVGADARARAGQLSDDATAQLVGYSGLALAIVALVATTVVLAARSIARPLGVLASQAQDVARNRLPQTVRRIQDASGEEQILLLAPPPPSPRLRHGSVEITEMAAALLDLERTAVGLAAEQAVLRRNTAESLANLGRRNQGLVRRQLGLITALESQEVDPDALGELFELDHLATRMRRNAESLLVLVGEQTPHPWAGTAGSLECLRAALSEVEQYRRVVIGEVEDATFRGHAVPELSHLLAELIENALTFSPPRQPVEVHGWRDTEAAAGDGDNRVGYCVAVVDHGVGMSAPDLDRSNARLSGEEPFLVAPTRFLGHYVVGRLAQRLDAEVRLFDTPGGGISALVTLPPRLLADRPRPAPGPRDPREISSALNGFRAGVARAESGALPRPATAAPITPASP